MTRIGGYTLALDDPATLAALAGAVLVLAMLLMALVAARRSGRAVEPLVRQMTAVSQGLQQMAQAQERLRGGLAHVSDAQTNAQVQVIRTVEARLGQVEQHLNDRLADHAMRSARSLSQMQERMRETLHGTSRQTATSLTRLQERLKAIDKAQDNITRLSGDVLGLQDILSNKQTRGAFGEIQLSEIVTRALPPDAYAFQKVLSNGRRADCLIDLPNPPGPIVIDSKFPLEPYEALRRATGQAETRAASQALRGAVRTHIRAIAERYVIEGETAEGALMFLPSEAVYAELHANFGDVVREGFAARVWIVSPTTCMATLNTLRAVLKDARMREQAGAIRRELGLLHKDVERLADRVGNLGRHFGQAARDIAEIRISADSAGERARRLDSFDFEDRAAQDAGRVLSLRDPVAPR